MINGKKVLAIIPARAGSKGLPGKNIRDLCGKPLIVWSIESALASGYIDTVVVSTDSAEIAAIARAAGADVPFLRPAEIAGDSASTYAVIRHALGHYRDSAALEFDYTVLLEPTSPLRQDGDIDRMLEQLDGAAARFDSIISVGEAATHPAIVKRLDGDTLAPFCPELALTTRRQDNAAAYFPYGVAYIAKTAALLAEDTFYTARCTHYAIARFQCYEIDDIYDFLCVENVMKFERRDK